MSVQAEERDFMKKKKHIISRVLPGSIAQELELKPGDILAAINDTPVEDVFDYRYLMNDEFVTLLIEKADGELWELEVEKEYEEDLGIELKTGLWMSTAPAPTAVFSALLIRCLRE